MADQKAKAHTVGSEFPPLTKSLLRLYSMRFCPYSQRVRLVLSAKGIKYETINVNSKKRPEWFSSELNPLSLQINHPCLHIDENKVIHESIIISEYLDSVYPEVKLIPKDIYERSINHMLIDGFQRVAGYLFKALKFKDAEAFNEIYKILDSYEKYLDGKDHFNGNEPGLVDYMIWPWFERFESLKPLAKNTLDETRFEKLNQWILRMLELPAVKETASNPEHMVEFYKVSLTNKEPFYDIGLDLVKEEPKEEPKEGEKPKEGEIPTETEKPKEGEKPKEEPKETEKPKEEPKETEKPKEGEKPKEEEKPKEGENPKEEEKPKEEWKVKGLKAEKNEK